MTIHRLVQTRRRAGRLLRLVYLGSWLLTTICLASPEATVVIANERVPGSVELAEYYVEQRGIPEGHLCRLDLPDGEVISRGDYEKRLRDPLLAFLREKKLIEQENKPDAPAEKKGEPWVTTASKIQFVVSVYGVPLRIADTKSDFAVKLAKRFKKDFQRNGAAVDSELAHCLASNVMLNGAVPNPYFSQFKFQPVSKSGPPFILIAARLDGPTPELARRCIDDALYAETYGLAGRAYFDGRSLKGDYEVGDYWIRESYERFKREGYECVLDTDIKNWGVGFPMTDVAVYMGWYAEHLSGPFTRKDFSFRRGSVAYHIHSGSALTLRSATSCWAGPFISRGAAATMGAVSEPYLSLTPHLDVFSSRLCEGRTFGESAYLAMSHLSWQITVVGDPLYRPFANSLDEQIKALKEDDRPELEWAMLRKVNKIIKSGDWAGGIELCKAQANQLQSLVLREKLGQLRLRQGKKEEAGAAFEEVLAQTSSPHDAARVFHTWSRLFDEGADKKKVEKVLNELNKRWPNHPVYTWSEFLDH